MEYPKVFKFNVKMFERALKFFASNAHFGMIFMRYHKTEWIINCALTALGLIAFIHIQSDTPYVQ